MNSVNITNIAYIYLSHSRFRILHHRDGVQFVFLHQNASQSDRTRDESYTIMHYEDSNNERLILWVKTWKKKFPWELFWKSQRLITLIKHTFDSELVEFWNCLIQWVTQREDFTSQLPWFLWVLQVSWIYIILPITISCWNIIIIVVLHVNNRRIIEFGWWRDWDVIEI